MSWTADTLSSAAEPIRKATVIPERFHGAGQQQSQGQCDRPYAQEADSRLAQQLGGAAVRP